MIRLMIILKLRVRDAVQYYNSNNTIIIEYYNQWFLISNIVFGIFGIILKQVRMLHYIILVYN